MDLFVVPTIGFDLLYAIVIVRLDRRDMVWINVTANPTAEWVARQITEAFPWRREPGPSGNPMPTLTSSAKAGADTSKAAAAANVAKLRMVEFLSLADGYGPVLRLTPRPGGRGEFP
ncbi:MAG: hypothetical protein KGL62_10215 [Bradyrhizobium sp.]|uniref:hypothetical protein n=1 Tax=Bradyrhizobium sp. TaxID=376 RepID=UPI00239EEB83|nr:hypothetical protein [Bradyrhizobium sp.]MDE2602726.1 hypothetical protein [Bradyrhizobium sp.]